MGRTRFMGDGVSDARDRVSSATGEDCRQYAFPGLTQASGFAGGDDAAWNEASH